MSVRIDAALRPAGPALPRPATSRVGARLTVCVALALWATLVGHAGALPTASSTGWVGTATHTARYSTVDDVGSIAQSQSATYETGATASIAGSFSRLTLNTCFLGGQSSEDQKTTANGSSRFDISSGTNGAGGSEISIALGDTTVWPGTMTYARCNGDTGSIAQGTIVYPLGSLCTATDLRRIAVPAGAQAVNGSRGCSSRTVSGGSTVTSSENLTVSIRRVACDRSVDSDRDGMGDCEEQERGRDPLTPDAAADSDGDGLSDAVEGAGESPPRDTDSDGTPDHLDADSDDDGLSDADEVARGTDPVRRDTDGDGADDGTEVDNGTDPLNAGSGGSTGPPKPTRGCTKPTLTVAGLTIDAACWKEVRKNVWELQGNRARVSGIDFEKRGDIRVDLADGRITGGGRIKVGSVVLYQGAIDVPLEADIKLKLSTKPRIGGIRITGASLKAHLTLNRAELTATASLSKPFEGLTGKLKFAATQKDGLQLTGATLKAKEIRLGGAGEIRDIVASYSRSADGPTFSGSAYLDFGGPARAVNGIGGTLVFVDGDFESLDARVGTAIHLGYGVFLSELRAGLAVDPLELRGGATFTLGPRIEGHSALSAKGDVEISFGESTVVHMTGDMKLVDKVELRSGSLTIDFTTLEASFTARSNFQLLGTGFTMDQAGYIGLNGFEARGSGEIRVFGETIGGGEGLVSEKGLAACRSGIGPDVGFGYAWGEDLPTVFASSCGVGDWASAAAQNARQRATALTDRRVTLPAGLRTAVFEVRGAGGAPRVVITSPGGAQFASPADRSALNTDAALILHDAATSRTYVAIDRPAAGAWTVSSDDPVDEVRSARSLPPLSPKVVLSRAGSRLRARWAITPAPGRTVLLVERAGSDLRTVATLSSARGSVTFTPLTSLLPRHELIVVARQRGIDVERVRVARFRVAPPALPAAVRGLRISGRGATRTVIWRAGASARSYRVATTAGGETTTTTIRRTSLRVPAPAGARLRVTVIAIDRYGRAGRPARAVG